MKILIIFFELIIRTERDSKIKPVMLKWDERDPSLLCVHYSGENEEILVCYWVTESGLVEQEELSFPSQVRSFLSLRAPNFIFSTNDGDVHQVALRDFVGIESCDDVTRQASGFNKLFE